MTLKKYRSIIAISIGSLLVTMSCDKNSILSDNLAKTPETSTNSMARIEDYTFDGTEGNPISIDSAAQWIENYKTINTSLSAHFFGRKVLEGLLSKNNCIGLRFYYSLDNSTSSNLLVTGANSKGNDLVFQFETRGRESAIDLNAVSSSTDRVFNITDADSVSVAVSKNWIGNYYQRNPKGIQAHFFGYEIIKQILSENGCVGIRAYYALNGLGVQQLLLIGVDSSGRNLLPSSGATGNERETDTTSNVIGDMSAPCPSYCGSGS